MSNPYLPAEIIEDRPSPLTVRSALISVGFAVVGGIALGGFTNLINGYICPDYFLAVMRWDASNILLKAIAQGMAEGTVYAVAYTLLLLVSLRLLATTQLSTSSVRSTLLTAFKLVFIIWLTTGAAFVVFKFFFPYLCNPAYFGPINTFPEAGFYAWVLGSIQGGVYGGVIAVPLSLWWHRRELHPKRRN
jgi:hypothetical protein